MIRNAKYNYQFHWMVQHITGDEARSCLDLSVLIEKIKQLLPPTVVECEEMKEKLNFLQNDSLYSAPEKYPWELKRLACILYTSTSKYRHTAWVKEIQTLYNCYAQLQVE